MNGEQTPQEGSLEDDFSFFEEVVFWFTAQGGTLSETKVKVRMNLPEDWWEENWKFLKAFQHLRILTVAGFRGVYPPLLTIVEKPWCFQEGLWLLNVIHHLSFPFWSSAGWSLQMRSVGDVFGRFWEGSNGGNDLPYWWSFWKDASRRDGKCVNCQTKIRFRAIFAVHSCTWSTWLKVVVLSM